MKKTSDLVSRAIAVVAAILLAACSPTQDGEGHAYRLGSITTWSEAVSVDIKDLALGSPLTTAETDALLEEATEIAGRFGVSVYREPDLLVSDLFRADIAEGKEVLLFYQPPTLERYLAVKERKAVLIAAGEYEGKAREEIARDFGRTRCDTYWRLNSWVSAYRSTTDISSFAGSFRRSRKYSYETSEQPLRQAASWIDQRSSSREIVADFQTPANDGRAIGVTPLFWSF